MPASYIDDITDDMIQERLNQMQGANVEWTCPVWPVCEDFDLAAYSKAMNLQVADVRLALGHDIMGDSPSHEIDMAISIAAEPDYLPDNACVNVFYRD